MGMKCEIAEHELICVIINAGLGSKAIHIAKRCGILGGTIYLGRGTTNNRILEFFALTEVRKEIVLMAASREKAEQTLEILDQVFKFTKPNHGIAFTLSLQGIIGARYCKCVEGASVAGEAEERDGGKPMYRLITVVVDKGKAEDVVEAASKAGSNGGTIINARGSGIHETSKLFSMDIEPEKEVVLILSNRERVEAIVKSIRDNLQIEKPGNGIIFTQDVNQTYGLYDEK